MSARPDPLSDTGAPEGGPEFNAGWQAFHDGEPASACPYQGRAAVFWRRGWEVAAHAAEPVRELGRQAFDAGERRAPYAAGSSRERLWLEGWAEREAEARAEGRAAFEARQPGNSKPYRAGTPAATAWTEGWLQAQAERAAASAGPSPDNATSRGPHERAPDAAGDGGSGGAIRGDGTDAPAAKSTASPATPGPAASPSAGPPSTTPDSEDDMARQLKTNGLHNGTGNGHGNDTGQGTTASHNADARKEAIRDALERTYQLDRRIEALIEQHIEPLRAEKRDIKKRMKDQYDVPTKRFNGRYAQYREERRAIENEDDTTLDAIRELYDVAPVGQQMDWIDAVGGGGQQPGAAA